MGVNSVFSQYWTLGILLIVKVPVPLSTTFQSWCHAQILVELFHLVWTLKCVFCWSSGVVMIVSTLGHRFFHSLYCNKSYWRNGWHWHFRNQAFQVLKLGNKSLLARTWIRKGISNVACLCFKNTNLCRYPIVKCQILDILLWNPICLNLLP